MLKNFKRPLESIISMFCGIYRILILNIYIIVQLINIITIDLKLLFNKEWVIVRNSLREGPILSAVR